MNAERHEPFFRLLHWSIFAEGTILTLSGLQLGGIPGFPLLPVDNFALHMIFGFAFVLTGVTFIADMVHTGDYRWVGLRRIPYSLRFIFAETRAWFHIGPRPPDPIVYDGTSRKYREKLVPSVIIVFWAFVLLGVILALSGLALAFPAQFWFVFLLVNPIGSLLTGTTGMAFMLVFHRIMTFLLVALVAAHVYASFVFGLVTSMITGTRSEPAVG